jgi:cytochrome c peroxidase
MRGGMRTQCRETTPGRKGARRRALAGSALAVVLATGAHAAQAAEGDGAAALASQARAIFGILPEEASSADNPVTDAKVKLGQLLYFDPRLSISGEISCNSCHGLDNFGVDGEPTSKGHEGQRGDRNAPTVFNAALHVAQFWDGRAADVEEQAKGPVLNPVEMAMPQPDVVEKRLREMPGYVALFKAAFPGESQPVSFDNMAKAIGAFERRLLTPSRFDLFQAGDTGALSAQEQKGLRTFIDVGCITCHNGATVGGQMFQKLGLVEPFETEDTGRYKLTGKESDKFVFKVPSLRNVTETGPYFHDGSVKELSQAVRLMGRHQLGKQLTDAQVADILSFFESLKGKADPRLVTRPSLPMQPAEGGSS